MFRLWGKEFRDNRMIKDIVITDDDASARRTEKVFNGLEQICVAFDLSIPVWLDSTVKDFKRTAKCRFTQDNFIDHIDFDFLEIQVIEEDC